MLRRCSWLRNVRSNPIETNDGSHFAESGTTSAVRLRRLRLVAHGLEVAIHLCHLLLSSR